MTAATLAPHAYRNVFGLLLAVRRLAPTPAPAITPTEAARLRDRDPDTWRALFEREMPALYRYAFSRLGNASEAEDATSQVFAEAWEHADAFQDQGLPARAWLFGIARNVINTHRRRFFGRPPAVAIEAFDGASHDPGLDTDLLDLARSLTLIEAAHAEVISLRFIHGLSLQETAVALGTSVDGVKGRQARALARLKDQLAERA